MKRVATWPVGSSRNATRAAAMREVTTLLFDLPTQTEEHDRTTVSDIPPLAERLAHAVDWVQRRSGIGLPLGLLGAGVGAAAALVAAVRLPGAVGAVVSHDGRPGLAGDALELARAPTL